MSVTGVHAPATLECTASSTNLRSFSNVVRKSLCSVSNKSISVSVPRLRLVSANVGSLHTSRKYANKEDVVSPCSRIAILEKLFHDAHFDVVAVHEGRFKDEQQVIGEHFTIFAAAADNGAYGSQLWFGSRFKYEHVATIVTCSRLISVVVIPRGHHTEVGFIAAHGPHSGDSRQAISEFWQLVSETINNLVSRFAHMAVALLTDSNGRVGSKKSNNIGLYNIF